MAKFLSSLFLVMIICIGITAQVGINNPAPHTSAALDIVSTDKGLLIPRVTSTANIMNPTTGLMVYQTNAPSGFYYYNGSAWTTFVGNPGPVGQGVPAGGTSNQVLGKVDGSDYNTQWVTPEGGGFTHYIGEQFGGGVIFHLWKDNVGVEHGLVVATTDQSTSQVWSNVSFTLIGAAAQSSWDGLSNSNAIVAQSGHTDSAAKICLDLVAGGQSDWYLPAIDELSLLWHNRFNVNKTLSTTGGATVLLLLAIYWSSTERNGSEAWIFDFLSLNASFSKDTPTYVRAVRAF